MDREIFAASFGITPGLVRADLAGHPPSITPNGIEMTPNANIETILQVHRRKMLRRAANRRSAQLSRARKKAHLEELKAENSRLQRMVDILDSQPELVFCVTASGKLTYVSERTINFIKINLTTEDSDEDPTHISQILTKESVDSVTETIAKLQKHTQTPTSDTDLNMLFAIKEVYFHDTFGHPVMGYLRCSKVHRRTSLHDLQSTDSIEKVATGGSHSSSAAGGSKETGPASKKLKKNNGSAGSSTAPSVSGDKQQKEEPSSGWNLSNFKMLADYASAFTEDVKEEEGRDTHPVNSNSTSSVAITESNKSGEVSPAKSDADEEEYVCVIRTTDNCFIQYRSHSDLLLFSSVVPSSNGHLYDLRTSIADERHSRGDNDSPSESNGNAQSETSGQQKTGTSSETGSDDNIIEEDT